VPWGTAQGCNRIAQETVPFTRLGEDGWAAPCGNTGGRGI